MAMACVLVTATSATAADAPSKSIAWREIASGANSAIEEATRMVIDDEQTWHAWWLRHAANLSDGTQPGGIKPPPVDFAKENVLVATLGMRSTGGYDIGFSAVTVDGKTLTAILRTTSPGPDDIVTRALTRPFAIIAVPKHDGEVLFRIE